MANRIRTQTVRRAITDAATNAQLPRELQAHVEAISASVTPENCEATAAQLEKFSVELYGSLQVLRGKVRA
jgi:hypothetical protein